MVLSPSRRHGVTEVDSQWGAGTVRWRKWEMEGGEEVDGDGMEIVCVCVCETVGGREHGRYWYFYPVTSC